jgi:hypothetical protein
MWLVTPFSFFFLLIGLTLQRRARRDRREINEIKAKNKNAFLGFCILKMSSLVLNLPPRSLRALR